MAGERYEFGVHAGFIDSLVSDRWDAEDVKSSRIDIIPSAANLIRKEKRGRRLDKLVYEVFSTIFLSELFKAYNSLFQSGDFTLYSPQTVGFVYDGNDDRAKEWSSVLYEFFCPGIPLNKAANSKRRDYSVGRDDVRAGDRIAYLAGIVYGIFLREGFSHGDPNLRHFIMLPEEGYLTGIRGEEILLERSRNGMGVIDLERCTLTGPYSSTAKKDRELFMERLFRKFSHSSAEEYFTMGSRKIMDESGSGIYNKEAYDIALRIFRDRFVYLGGVDMESRKVLFNTGKED